MCVCVFRFIIRSFVDNTRVVIYHRTRKYTGFNHTTIDRNPAKYYHSFRLLLYVVIFLFLVFSCLYFVFFFFYGLRSCDTIFKETRVFRSEELSALYFLTLLIITVFTIPDR